MIPAALSIDLESYWHAELLRSRVDRGMMSDRVEEATRPLLDLLARHQVRATFFVVGEVMEAHPQLIQAIVAAGHELACHGYTHRPLWELDEATFAAEIQRFRDLAAQIVPQTSIWGFRAPTFSLSPATAWALEVLARYGYHYDSSVFPMKTPLYGVPRAPRRPYRPGPDLITEVPDGPLWEWPMTVWSAGPLTLPVCGGFYLRALPMPVILHGLMRAASRGPVVVYLHPWELDPGTPRLPLPPRDRFITYYHLGDAMRDRVVRLFRHFDFRPMREWLFSKIKD